MANAPRLIETRLFRSYWDDGLLDLLCGLALLVMGLGWLGGLGAIAIAQAPLWVLLWVPLRRRIVEPRVGFVRFSVSRQQRTEGALRGTLALGVGTLAMLAAVAFFLHQQRASTDLEYLVRGLPAVLVAVAAALAGLLTGTRRFQAYGLALGAGAVATVLLVQEPALPLAAVGLVATMVGTVLLFRFVRASRAFDGHA